MSEQAEYLLEACGFYESREYCEIHPKESWSVSDEYGCRRCLEESEEFEPLDSTPTNEYSEEQQ